LCCQATDSVFTNSSSLTASCLDKKLKFPSGLQLTSLQRRAAATLRAYQSNLKVAPLRTLLLLVILVRREPCRSPVGYASPCWRGPRCKHTRGYLRQRC